MLEKKVSRTHEFFCEGSRIVNNEKINSIPEASPKRAIVIIFDDGSSKALCPYLQDYGSCGAIKSPNKHLKLPCIYKNRS